jgi:hypothetical protein
VQASIVKGYEGGLAVGQRQKWTYYGSGPASYAQATGDPISVPPGVYLDSVEACMDTTGTYIAVPFPTTVGSTRATWSFLYFTASGMVKVGNAVNLSTFNFQFSAWGGEF